MEIRVGDKVRFRKPKFGEDETQSFEISQQRFYHEHKNKIFTVVMTNKFITYIDYISGIEGFITKRFELKNVLKIDENLFKL